MWRAFFLAVGIYLIILGGECLVVDKAVFAGRISNRESNTVVASLDPTTPRAQSNRREFDPPDWLPWSLLSTGAVIILYSFTIPKRINN